MSFRDTCEYRYHKRTQDFRWGGEAQRYPKLKIKCREKIGKFDEKREHILMQAYLYEREHKGK